MRDNSNPSGEETPGGGVVQKDDIEFEPEQSEHCARANSGGTGIDHPVLTPDEDTVGDTYTGTYPDVVVGSDSATTGTDWGLPAVEGGEVVYTPKGGSLKVTRREKHGQRAILPAMITESEDELAEPRRHEDSRLR